MSERTLHDVKRRLEIMADLLHRGDFAAFSEEEIRRDADADLEHLKALLKELGQ